MDSRRFDSKLKSQIVLEGLRGRKVSEICLDNSHQAFETTNQDRWINEFKDVWEIKKEIEKWVEISCAIRKRNSLNCGLTNGGHCYTIAIFL